MSRGASTRSSSPAATGHVWDLASSSDVSDLVERVWMDGGIVAALCHGPAALINANDEDGRRALVAGKRVNAFTDEEEKTTGLYDIVPFHLEEELRALGAKFESSGKQQAHVTVDGRLVTGQNPASARASRRRCWRAWSTHQSRSTTRE